MKTRLCRSRSRRKIRASIWPKISPAQEVVSDPDRSATSALRKTCGVSAIEVGVMSNTTSCDVLVVGGGPAGCAAALTLLKYSPLSVAVVECSDYDQTRVGETVSPGVQPLLGYL